MSRVSAQVRVLGFTATPYRLDGGLIHGEDRLFRSLIFEAPVADLIRDGWLCPLSTKLPEQELDTAGVRMRGGDFLRGELERAVDTEDLVRQAVAELVERTRDRHSVLVFAAGVDHARHVAQEIQAHDLEAQVVVGDTSPQERAEILERFAAGDLRYVVNVECLTTGLDVERIDAIACLRPTWSTGLWVQMVGRGLRQHPDKDDCLVLDFAGNAVRHGPLDALDVQSRRKGDGTGQAPVKVCPACREVVALGCRRCRCGHEWPAHQVRHDARAGEAAVIGPQRTRHQVLGVEVARHQKPDRPPSLRITYTTPEGECSEWLCLEHGGFAAQQARRWWGRRFGWPPPRQVDQALEFPDLAQRILELTESIKVKREGRFANVVGHVLRAHEEART